MRLVVQTVIAAALALSAAACTQTGGSPAPGTPVGTGAAFRMPEGPGCQGEVARYRAIMANDLAMGHVNQSVYSRVDKEIDRADAACSAGRDAEAIRMIEATKGRYGYR
ncbi:hypothetical protein [Microvirga antarctica]|uniref:hypothetical protein n=1 Tax=Microvirga antarctica TaxID=2819233 RepID=UPI001B30DE7C|nr:hypothetical protein [Microvirga antarctica]